MANNNGNSALALLFGAAIGVGVGMMFAPDKGSKTRRKIKSNLGDLKDQAKSKYSLLEEEAKEKFAKTKTELKDTVEEFLSHSSVKADDAITFLEQKLADLKRHNAKFQK